MIRFHLDQHIPNSVARGLRLRGIDVSTTAEAGLQDADDVDHLAFALSENRVLVTQDADFLRLWSSYSPSGFRPRDADCPLHEQRLRRQECRFGV
jgi:predicted nuclease of predicted toxin-antitoxin system